MEKEPRPALQAKESVFGTRSLLILAAWIGVLFVFNYLTQPYEDAVGDVVPSTIFFLDPVWYLDDIIGPALFLTAGVLILRRTGLRAVNWPLIGLGLACLAFGAGDTFDAHWVFPEGIHAAEEAVSFSSWISKIMAVITFCVFITLSYDAYDRTAQKAMVIGFLLLFIDQIQMSISFDFAGYSFHVFEETMEVVIGFLFCFGIGARTPDPERLRPSVDR